MVTVEVRRPPHGAHGGSGVGDVARAGFQGDEHRQAVAEGEERRPDPGGAAVAVGEGVDPDPFAVDLGGEGDGLVESAAWSSAQSGAATGRQAPLRNAATAPRRPWSAGPVASRGGSRRARSGSALASPRLNSAMLRSTRSARAVFVADRSRSRDA